MCEGHSEHILSFSLGKISEEFEKESHWLLLAIYQSFLCKLCNISLHALLKLCVRVCVCVCVCVCLLGGEKSERVWEEERES